MPRALGERGVALLMTIILIVGMTLLAAAALNASFQYRNLRESIGVRHTQSRYRAQAGVVDARWRIRNNVQGDYRVAAFDPAPYELDIDNDGTMDVTVDIGPAVIDPAGANNLLRPIRSTSRE